MKAQLISFFSGIVFAIGLSISGMINPNKVKNFLNILGNWDYSLALVMVGAVGFNYFTFKYFKNKKPLCAPSHFLPNNNEIDKNLIIGSALFGTGWGLVGICPGPAIVNLVTLDHSLIIFVISMISGMVAFSFYEKLKK